MWSPVVNFILSFPSRPAKHAGSCMQLANSAGNLAIGALLKQIHIFILYFKIFPSVFREMLECKELFHVTGNTNTYLSCMKLTNYFIQFAQGSLIAS